MEASHITSNPWCGKLGTINEDDDDYDGDDDDDDQCLNITRDFRTEKGKRFRVKGKQRLSNFVV